MEPLTGPAPRPPWSCTVSVLAGSLGGTHICASPGASCVLVHPCWALPRIGSRTTGSGRFPEMQTGLSEQLRTDSKSAGPPEDGVSTPQGVPLETARRPPDWTLPGCGWHEGTSDASDSRGGSVKRLAGWYTQRSQCCPYGPERPFPEGALWGGSRQGVLPETQGNWYANTVGTRPYPWHCVPVVHGSPASGWGIREYYSIPGYLLQGHSCPKERGIWPRAEGFTAGRCNLNPWVPRFHAHLGIRPWSQCWSGLIWSRPSGTITAAAAICPSSCLVLYRNTWETLSALLLKTSKLKNHGFDQLVSQRNWHHLLDEKHGLGGA